MTTFLDTCPSGRAAKGAGSALARRPGFHCGAAAERLGVATPSVAMAAGYPALVNGLRVSEMSGMSVRLARPSEVMRVCVLDSLEALRWTFQDGSS